MGRYTLDKRAVLGSKPRVGTKKNNAPVTYANWHSYES